MATSTIPATLIKGRTVYVIVSEDCYGGSDRNMVKVFEHEAEAEQYLEELWEGLDDIDFSDRSEDDRIRGLDRVIKTLIIQ